MLPNLRGFAVLKTLSARSPLQSNRNIAQNSAPLRTFAARTAEIGSEEELRTARLWLSSFNIETIPRNICELTFSRSSGPGGQNVNKVNSKATLKVPLTILLRQIPPALHAAIRDSRFCKAASDSIVIQTEESRKQSDNTHGCFVKLYDLIVEAGSRSVPGETSDAQRERVKGLQKAANACRLAEKKDQSKKKSARNGGRSSSDY